MNYRMVLSVVAIAAIPSPAFSGFFDGNELYAGCTEDRAFVASYVAGVVDKQQVDVFAALNMRMAASSLTGAENDWFISSFNDISTGSCAPEKVTLKQFSDFVCGWLETNPDKRDESAAVLIGLASSSIWQCKQNN